jgi:hypothetical protein
METCLNIDVASLDPPHRRALEEVLGRQLAANERLTISITELTIPSPPQTLEDWTHVYEGLTDEEIEEIDKIAKTRADLTRDLP